MLTPYTQIAAQKRVESHLYRLYNVTTLELSIILSFIGVREIRKKPIMSERDFIEYLSGSPAIRKKFHLGLFHCYNKKFFGSYEYLLVPESRCVGLSELGEKIGKDYVKELEVVIAKIDNRQKTTSKMPLHHYRLREVV